MKTKLHRPLIASALLALSTFNLPLSTAQAQGTAFMYQGRLNDGAGPANGSYDMAFSLFGAGTGGSQVGSTLTFTALGVTNGLFTATLDFGPGVLTGANLWLDISVRASGGGAFSELVPRQPLTPAPYAVMANSASNILGALPAGQLVGTIPMAQLPGVVITNNEPGVTLGNVTINGGLNLPTTATISSGGDSFLAGLTIDPNNQNIGSVDANALTFGTSSGEGIASKRSGAVGSWDLEFYTKFNNRMTILQDGNVGIGTTNPWALLEVNGTVLVDQDTYLLGNVTIGGSLTTGTSGGNSLIAAGLNVDPNNQNIGNVYSNALTFGRSSGEGIASKRSGASGSWDLEFYTDFDNRMTVSQNGNVGIHTTTPSETLEINGTSRIDDNDIYMRSGSDRNHGLGYRQSVGGTTVDGPFLYGWTGGALGTPSPESIALSWDRQGDVTVANNLSAATLTIRGGADVAEPFPVTGGQVEPGTVMVIDEANPGRLSRSTRAYDTRVAGIISGAGGIRPGLELQQDGVLDQGQKVALSGRVYVQADACTGAIKPGDLLTTSEAPGCAMKVSDHARAQGAILGKAMTGLTDGRGLVLVLVTLQ
jgi:hypothetical protein